MKERCAAARSVRKTNRSRKTHFNGRIGVTSVLLGAINAREHAAKTLDMLATSERGGGETFE